MWKLYCDRCNVEIPEADDARVVSLIGNDGKPAIPKMEICLKCKIEIEPVLRGKHASS